MTEVHEDYGPSYPYSDHKCGDHVAYRLEGHTEHGEILWVAAGGKLPSGRDMPPHYVVAPDRGGFPDMVMFSDICVDEEPVLVKCPYCSRMHPAEKIESCPFNPDWSL